MKQYSRYERQMILREIGREGQRRLDKSSVAIIGLGALGSVSANLLARAGIGRLLLIDRDFIEIGNLQRQVLYDEKDLNANLPKAVAAQRKLQGINSEIKVEAEVTDINASSIEELLGKVDLIVDGTDNFETRFLINDFSLKHKVPWIYGGAIRTEGMSYVILPGEGPCLRCLFGETANIPNAQTCDQIGILAPVAHLIASFQTMEAIKYLSGKKTQVERALWKVDLWSRQFKSIAVERLKGSGCSGCEKKQYPFLEKKKGTKALTLCGRNAVQIYREGHEKIDFGILASSLAGRVDVEYNDYLMRLRMQPYEMTLFTNGRAIVKGTENIGQAKSLYAKFVGA